MEASLADETLGYPDRVAFVAADNPHREDIVWRNLSEHVPTVIVDEDALEIMLVPVGSVDLTGGSRYPRQRWHRRTTT